MKNQADEGSIKLINANGDIKQNTLIIIYLNEYENTKLSKPKYDKLFIIPVNEKIFIFGSFICIVSFNKLIKEEKQIFLLNISSPILLIKSDIVDVKLIICEHIKNDEFISIAKNINLKINCIGRSVWVMVMCESNNFIA